MPSANVILWIYIVLLLVGGLIGFLKARSKVSLYMSCGFAAALSLCAIPNLFHDQLRATLANVLLAVLLVVFGVRLGKTRKFMPAGLMLAATILVLALHNIKF